MTPPARDPLEHRTEPYRATTTRVVRRRDGARACRQVYLHARRQRSAPDLPAYRSRGRSSNHVFEGAEPVAPIRSSPRSVCARDGVRTAGWGTASLRRRGLSQRRVISLRGRFLWARFPARRPFFPSFLSIQPGAVSFFPHSFFLLLCKLHGCIVPTRCVPDTSLLFSFLRSRFGRRLQLCRNGIVSARRGSLSSTSDGNCFASGWEPRAGSRSTVLDQQCVLEGG